MIQFINPFHREDITEYDVIITHDLFTSRLSVKVVNGQDLDALGVELEAKELQKHIYQLNRESILGTLEDLRESFKEKVETGTISIEQILSTSQLINQYLGAVGVNLVTPSLQNLLLDRIDDTVNQLKNFYSSVEVNDTIKNASLALLSNL